MKPFGVSPDDCTSVATNFVLSIITLLVSVAAIVVYVYYGRLHRIAFLRTERIVHVLIEKYKLTIAALKSLQGHLKQLNSPVYVSDPRHYRKVVLFWVITITSLLFVPPILFVFILWRRLLDVLILWNGWRDEISNYKPMIDAVIGAIGLRLRMPDFIKAIFDPARLLLDALSKIKFDLGAMKISCEGAQAPYFLLVQIIIFGIAFIVISADYQVFKTNLFGSLIDTFAGVTASRGYRNFVFLQDQRFHWSPLRYFRYLCYAALAEVLAFSLDFPTILKFCIALVRWDGIAYFYTYDYPRPPYMFNWVDDDVGYQIQKRMSPDQRHFFLFSRNVFYLWLCPFFSYPIAGLDRYGHIIKFSNYNPSTCNGVQGYHGISTYLAYTTFFVSLAVLIPLFYEIGKIVVPGNRVPKALDALRLAPRVEPCILPDWEVIAYLKRRVSDWESIASLKRNMAGLYDRSLWAIRRMSELYDRSLWALSFLSGDLYVSALADVWLKIVHTAIPPSALAASSAENDQVDAKNKHASLGWSAVLRKSELERQVKADDKRHCLGLLSSDNVFWRIWSPTEFGVRGDLRALNDEYVGEVNERGQKHGFGTLKHDGGVYEGNFENDVPIGFGRQTDIKTNNVYVGEFQDGVYNGIGLYKDHSKYCIYMGQWADCELNGKVRVKEKRVWTDHEYKNGKKVRPLPPLEHQSRYDGSHNEQNERHGHGTSFEENGEIYVGEYLNGQRHGLGALFFRSGEAAYYGEWRENEIHGQGRLFNTAGPIVKGEWERGIKKLLRRFALKPAKSAEEEDARWDEFKCERVLPTYSEFISYQYQRLITLITEAFFSSPDLAYVNKSLPVRLLVKLVSAGLVWYGVGNFLRVSRSIWYQILRNFFVFFVSTVGVWTREARVLYAVDECIEATSVKAEPVGSVDGNAGPLREEEEGATIDASYRWTQYSRAWASILAPRFILYMVVPQLTPVMLYATVMAPTPLYIADSHVPLPDWFDFASYYSRSRREIASGEGQEWMAGLDMVYLFATESRLVQTLLNLYKFTLSIALWQAGKLNRIVDVESWAISALVVFVPYCYVLTLRLVVYLGKALNIKNEDVFYSPVPKMAPSPSPSTFSSTSPATSTLGVVDPIPVPPPPQALRRQSAGTFASQYPNHDEPDVELSGDVELPARGVIYVQSPFAHEQPSTRLSLSVTAPAVDDALPHS